MKKICCICSRLSLKTHHCRHAEAFGETQIQESALVQSLVWERTLKNLGKGRAVDRPDLPSQRRKRR